MTDPRRRGWLRRPARILVGLLLVSALLVSIGAIWAGPVYVQPPWVPPPSPPVLSRQPATFELMVQPVDALIDEPVSITVTGLEPGEEVVVRAETEDADSVRFVSWGRFRAGADGSLDLANQAPLEGSYRSADPSGLLWSMRAGDRQFITSRGWTVRTYVVTAETSTGLASVEIVRRYPWNTLRHTAVESPGIQGELWLPPTPLPAPAVIRMGGYGDGPAPLTASLLAARGFVVLDLRYHGSDEEEWPELVKVPLEVVSTAVDYLAAHEAVLDDAIGVMGRSKGAELALLAASHDPRLKAVAAWVPASVAFAGISFRSVSPPSSWTLAGAPLPYAAGKLDATLIRNALRFLFRRPVSFRSAYETLLERSPENTRIPAERIEGPILLAGGGADLMWPSAEMTGEIETRLARQGFSHDVTTLVYPDAGHALTFALWPRGAPGFSLLERGGTPEADHLAGREAWERMIEMFDRALKPPTTDKPPPK